MFAAAVFITSASSTILLPTADLLRVSAAVCRGRVVGMISFRGEDGLIYTRTSLRVHETFKGKFPETVAVVHRGGRIGNEEDYFGLSPKFAAGAEYVVFLARGRDGRLHCTQGAASAFYLGGPQPLSSGAAASVLAELRSLTADGAAEGADVTDQVGNAEVSPLETAGMLNNVNARFLQPDRGEPILYLIDADTLPEGITLSQATNAVHNALEAWAAVTSLQFRFEGIQSFGQGADTIALNDEKLRIQLHDNYSRITSPNVLGIGGRGAISSVNPNGWDIGGNVAGNEFWKSTRGYVILEATNASMQVLSTFEEVLCHEIGHALNLAHSSEVETNDPFLTEAMMYFQAHKDGRGATLGAYDPPIIQQIYPFNTAPFTFDRFMDAVSAPMFFLVDGINETEVAGYDLQSTDLTIILGEESQLNGLFSVFGNRIRYTQSAFGAFEDSNRWSPEENMHWDLVYFRVSDGTNASPWATLRVLSFAADNSAPTDGIPDSWMVRYFGHPDPRADDLSRATDDPDGDGLTNLQEYIAATDPTDPNSAQRITEFSPGTIQFQARAYDLYEILGSTDLQTWTLAAVPHVPTNAPPTLLTNILQTNILTTVSNLPANGSHRFFRIRKVP
ncbi:MAG TPA: hypothetical protein GYA07_11145 [Verrucomicrobia bacterium]|nr:hypothetical protein [Verrucomicrobiota bacterium]